MMRIRLAPGTAAYLASSFEAIEIGHGHVHQDHIRPERFGDFDRATPIGGRQYNVPVRLQ